jgi:outer membrane protein insertion porin family
MSPRNHFLAAVTTVCVATSPLAVAQTPPAPIVKSIDIQYAGPSSVSKSRVLANMRTAVGKPYSDVAVEEDIRNLYATGAITNVRIFGEPQVDGVKVIVVIQTKTRVKEVRFEGVSQVKTGALRKLLLTKPTEQLSEANVEADRQKILDYYQDRGYKDTEVKTEVAAIEKSEDSVVIYKVTESIKTKVKKVDFEGNANFKASVLRKVVKTSPHSLLSFFTKSGRIENEQLLADVNALREFYESQGYADVQVGMPQLERVDQRPDVTLIFPITEGKKYQVGKVSVEGAQVITSEEIAKELKSQPGAVYSPQKVSEDVKFIQDLYGSRGYVDLQVIPETSPAGPQLTNVIFRLDEGVESYVERVNISGNTRTKDKVIRRELAVAPGDVYNTVRVEASKDILKNLGYFERVDTFPSDTGIPGKKDLNVVVEEKRTGSLNFGVGFSSVDSVTGFVELSQSNFDISNWPTFTGGGQRFRTRVQYGDRRRDFVISLTEPYFLDYRLAVGGELFYRDATYLSSVYDQRNYGFAANVRKGINEFASWRVDYRLEQIKIYNIDSDVSPEILKEKGEKLKSQLSPSLVYDTRDSISLPRSGNRAELSTYVAGGPLGGDVEIFGFDLQATQYVPLPWDTIFSVTGQIGGVDKWGGGDRVPIFDRLYLGGSGNLRGFDFRDVGPKDENNEPIGGKSLARVSVDYTFPLIDRVRGGVFYDAGFVNRDAFSYGADDISSDFGFGVRLDLPIGVVRLDYGIPIDRGDATSDNGRFNFNLGSQF